MQKINAETLKALAAASGWKIPEVRLDELVFIYNGIVVDTEPVQQLDLGSTPPAPIFEAE